MGIERSAGNGRALPFFQIYDRTRREIGCMNRQMSKLCTHLSHKSLDDIMHINIDSDSMENFKPRRHVMNWIEKADGIRHIEGHKTPVPKKRDLNSQNGPCFRSFC